MYKKSGQKEQSIGPARKARGSLALGRQFNAAAKIMVRQMSVLDALFGWPRTLESYLKWTSHLATLFVAYSLIWLLGALRKQEWLDLVYAAALLCLCLHLKYWIRNVSRDQRKAIDRIGQTYIVALLLEIVVAFGDIWLRRNDLIDPEGMAFLVLCNTVVFVFLVLILRRAMARARSWALQAAQARRSPGRSLSSHGRPDPLPPHAG